MTKVTRKFLFDVVRVEQFIVVVKYLIRAIFNEKSLSKVRKLLKVLF